MEIQLLSNDYDVRRITNEDVEDVFQLCMKNLLYYEYCPPIVTRESIQRDLMALPPNTPISDKYYVGFYQNSSLIAVMDLIDGYPQNGVAFIGFFMTDKSVQKKGIGTKIIQGICIYLKKLGFNSIQLAWVKGNPQSEHFWLKNQFVKIKETSSTVADNVILAERLL